MGAQSETEATAMMHLICVDYFPFAYCYAVLVGLLLRKPFLRDLDALFSV
jgi:hypothetical protein